MFKRLHLFGTMLRGRSVATRRRRPPTRSRATSCRCSRRARCAPVIARTLPLDDAREAYDLLAADAVFGTIVLDLT